MVFLMICTFLIPVIQVIAGWAMRYHTPKQINSWIGYRTMRSTKDETAWLFANRYCGKLWLTAGVGNAGAYRMQPVSVPESCRYCLACDDRRADA